MQMVGSELANQMIEQQIRIIVGEKLRCKPDELPSDVTLEDIGFDSLGLSDLAETVQSQMDVDIPNRVFPGRFTLKDVVEFLAKELNGFSEASVDKEPAD